MLVYAIHHTTQVAQYVDVSGMRAGMRRRELEAPRSFHLFICRNDIYTR